MKRFIVVLLVHGLLIAGCASREYVNTQVNPIREKIRIQEKACCEAPKHTPFLDLNGDQRISYEEFNHFLGTLFRSVERKLDSNGDNTISSEEYFHGKSTRRYIFVAKRMDTDNDGWITPKEFKQYHKRRFQTILAVFDVKHDSLISKEDFVSHNQKKFSMMDKDSNGFVDLSELNTYLEKLPAGSRAKGNAYWQYCYKPEIPQICMSFPIPAPPLVSGPGNSWGGVSPSNPEDGCFVTDFFDECFVPWPENEDEKSMSSVGFFFQ